MKTRIAMLVAVSLALPGCAGYRLGSMLPPDIRTIAVPVFVNKTGEPRLESRCTSAAIQEFQVDGTVRVLPENEADAVVGVVLRDYRLESLSYQRDRAKTTSEYRAWLTVDIEFRRTRTDQVLFKKQLRADATFEVVPGLDLAGAKERALPDIAKDLAHRIVESVVEYW